jgi:YebC/PmpR family DNA-binding regulatory protein
MSGHSKWSNIKHQKQASDTIRGQAFTKLANAITIIVRESQGNGDSSTNFKLRLAIEKAKKINMPKINIERAISRGKGNNGSNQDLFEVIYEGFAPGGVAVLVEGITDNKQRTAALIKNIFSTHEGHLGGVGSVLYLFKQVGEVHIEKSNFTYDKLIEFFINENIDGVNDIEEESDRFVIISKVNDLHHIKNFLDAQKINVLENELTYRSTTNVFISDQKIIDKIINLLTLLDNMEDIHKVHANFIAKL